MCRVCACVVRACARREYADSSTLPRLNIEEAIEAMREECILDAKSEDGVQSA